jgi:hypothetical protein
MANQTQWYGPVVTGTTAVPAPADPACLINSHTFVATHNSVTVTAKSTAGLGSDGMYDYEGQLLHPTDNAVVVATQHRGVGSDVPNMGTEMQFTFTGLNPSTAYRFRVRALPGG